MLVRWCVAIASVVVALVPTSADAATRLEEPGEAPSLSFERDIRPIFREHCIHCHGEEDDPKAGLDLRFVRTMLDGGLTGEAIVPGDRDGSFLWHRVEDDVMPPGDGNPRRLDRRRGPDPPPGAGRDPAARDGDSV
jgi:hypothetical protein